MTQNGALDVALLCVQARVLYCSAKGASEPKNLAYMTRLSTFGHENIRDMINALSGSGTRANKRNLNKRNV
jgi:hypothetical protein